MRNIALLFSLFVLITSTSIAQEELTSDSTLIEMIDPVEEELTLPTIESETVIDHYIQPAKRGNISDYYFELDDTELKTGNTCNIVFDGYDETLDENRRETEASEFFSYTHPKIKPHLKSDDFLVCKANVAKVGKEYFLKMYFDLASKDASRNYGQIERNSIIRLQMIDGQKYYLTNNYPDPGRIEKYTGHTLYKAVMKLSKDDLKVFSKEEVDHVGIIWTTGYEQYDVYEVDFLINQIKCLKDE